jgi:PAS domain S-box-containing protein
VIDALAQVRRVFREAGGHPVRLAQEACDMLVAQRWGRAARLAWSAEFAQALTDAGLPTDPVLTGEPGDASWTGARELGLGPAGRYSLLLMSAVTDANGLSAVGALAAGLDAWLEAWQRDRTTQALLRRAESDREHFQRLFDTVPVSTAIVAINRAIVDVNQVFCERYGMTREQMIGRNLDELGIGYVEEDRIRLGVALRAERRVRNMTLRGVRRDGTPGKFLLNAEMADFDGQDCALVSSMDITDMLAAEAAIQARLQAETESRAKGEMLARIAEEKAESDRLRVLADAARTDLQRLSDFGRQVTASLDPAVIVETLRNGLPALIPTDGVRVLVLDGDDELLDATGDAAGTRSAGATDAAASLHQRELRACIDTATIATLARVETAPPWPGAPADARVALAAPLLSQQRPIGLLVVYSRTAADYGPTHRAMLETLALHAASAIANSRAYARLQIAQEQLVEREKMAALGSLVAGVAHELNTPLGNALLLVSTLNERVQSAPEAAAAPGPQDFTQLVKQAGPLIERSLRSAATLVASFKQVAADQTADRRRPFDLAVLANELEATLHGRLQPHHHTLALDIEPGIAMDSYPGALTQVLTNLILNAIQHGLDGRSHGRITIVARPQRRDEVLIEVSDDGCGISAAHLGRVFEPFFTTRLGAGGTGLGLSVSYNIVTAVLGGTIRVSSPAGSGARFTIVMPRVAGPEPVPAARSRLMGLR